MLQTLLSLLPIGYTRIDALGFRPVVKWNIERHSHTNYADVHVEFKNQYKETIEITKCRLKTRACFRAGIGSNEPFELSGYLDPNESKSGKFCVEIKDGVPELELTVHYRRSSKTNDEPIVSKKLV